ncbi:MAG: HAMP domain-containing protein [Clostridiales bacterium]|nr:HAMP domain-containing protein [Clostridiales bacterium]
MRKNKPGLNILLGVTYILIVVAVLAIITLSVTTYLGKYFLNIRYQEQTDTLKNCASALLPYMEDMDPDVVNGVLSDYAMAGKGRMLFIDQSGCVQADTFSTLNGTMPYSEEIASVLSGNQDTAVGYHKQTLSPTAITKDNAYLNRSHGTFWAGYYTHAVIMSGEQKGVLVLSAPVQDIVENVTSVAIWLSVFSLVFTIIVSAITFYVSNNLTLSIRKFNRAIGKMSGGDFSTRVDENEIAEFGELAKAFNMMSEKLENLDNSRNQFVSDASHELKTPLASMKILSESLLSQPDAPKELYQEFMGDINNEVDRLSLVINDLLTLVKTDKGADTLILGSVDLSKLIRKITGTVAPLARSKHITVSYEYVDTTLQGDELRLQQVFTNLIDNAIKYSPENTVVKVTLSQSQGNAVVTVEDQGIGMSNDDLNHIFERFYRVDKGRSRQAGGTGLGLSIVKQIVEQHGGNIDVKSVLSEGTTFTITLPLSR